MSKKPMSKSARIRKMLEQGKSVKQIAATVQCTPQMVYQIRAADKKKVEKKPVIVPGSLKGQQKDWVMVTTSTSKEPIGIPKDVYLDHMPPLDYHQPKQGIFKRIANWFFGG